MAFFKAIWKGNLRHKKLNDEGTLTGAFDTEFNTESSPEEVMFRAKYLGSVLVEKAASEEATAEAIKTILSMAKACGKKLRRVVVSFGINGIKVADAPTEELHLDVPIYSISYCSADAAHSQVFAFIATNANETMECHAFLCRKRKTAQIMSLTLASVFRAAYDLIEGEINEKKYFTRRELKKEFSEKDILRNENCFQRLETTLLIDFTSDIHQNRLSAWECFDETAANDLNYSKLWEEKKRQHQPVTFHSDSVRNIFESSVPWEDIRTDVLCS